MIANTVSRYLYRLTVNNQYLGITVWTVYCPLLAQGLVVDHAPPTITASYDKALLWTTMKTVLMRDLSTDSF